MGNGGIWGIMVVLEARVGELLRFRGEALLDGESRSSWTLCSGSKSSGGSMFSLLKPLLVLPEVLGVPVTEFVVFRRGWVCLRGLF